MTLQRADAVVVAAGSSRRMAGQDKLTAEILGRPVLRWAVEAMASSSDVADVVVVAAPDRVASLEATPWLRNIDARVVSGGGRRQDSVAAGVRATNADVVLVHDAARPLVSTALVSRVVDAAARDGAAIPVLPVVDALKHLDNGVVSGTADRSGLYRAQTPQGARRELLIAATETHAGSRDAIADEAELLARDGIPVTTVPGEAANIKVTLPSDLELARRLARDASIQRVAQGSDSHPFGPGAGLRLGGLLIEEAPQLYGHSDGDVVLHALCDALLGAARMGDLGRLYPSGEASTRGIDSRELVQEVMTRLDAEGLQVLGADVSIHGARPRLGARRLDGMAAAIADLVRVPPMQVSVKASTDNLSGDEGAGRAISATCLATVMPR